MNETNSRVEMGVAGELVQSDGELLCRTWNVVYSFLQGVSPFCIKQQNYPGAGNRVLKVG
ncbi:hypothetical protein SAMN04488030_1079 [Aliiroseovarius halocynthiae]|nr:hypothetical protein SAMN04488030_1079 [Aliiroseovarius halocynthiae]